MNYRTDGRNISDTARRPRIGITMRLELETDRFYLGRFYSEAVENAGGIPVHISLIPRREYIAQVVDQLDGILLPGSDSDVDPSRYGADPHPELGRVVEVKDQTDLLVLEEVEARNLPLFAICFGMQVFNVSRGGTLIQDINSQFPNPLKHQQGVPRDRRSHRVQFSNGSVVHDAAAAESSFVNSHHHQALETVGRDLKATAWSSDGLIEAVEDTRPDRFAVAVQWHPEIDWENDEMSQALFSKFIAAAREYQGSQERQPSVSPIARATETSLSERSE